MTADAAAQPPKACADCRLRQLTCFLPTTPAVWRRRQSVQAPGG